MPSIRAGSAVVAIALVAASCGPRIADDGALLRRRDAAVEFVVFTDGTAAVNALTGPFTTLLKRSTGREARVARAGEEALSLRSGSVPVVLGNLQNRQISHFIPASRVAVDDPHVMTHFSAGDGNATGFFIDAGPSPLLGLCGSNPNILACAIDRALRDPGFLIFPVRPGAMTLYGGDGVAPWTGMPGAASEVGSFIYHFAGWQPGPGYVEQLTRLLDETRIAVHKEAGHFDIQPISIVLYPSLDAKEAVAGGRELAGARRAGRRVDAVAAPGLDRFIVESAMDIIAFSQFGISGEAEGCRRAAAEFLDARISREAPARGKWPRGYTILEDPGGRFSDIQFKQELDRIRATGAGSVLLTAWRKPGAGPQTFFAGGPGDDELCLRAQLCRAAGLEPWLGTRMLGVRAGGLFTEAHAIPELGRAAFLRDLREVIIHDAKLAQKMGAAGFFAGMELRGATTGTDAAAFWSDLIKECRSVYRGAISYTASFDWISQKRVAAPGRDGSSADGGLLAEFEAMEFIDSLDMVSVAGMMPLSIYPNPTGDMLDGAVADFVRRLAETTKRHGKPLVLVDVGYPMDSRAHMSPWRLTGVRDFSGGENCYRSLFRALERQEKETPGWLGGMFIFGWAIPPRGGAETILIHDVASGPIPAWFESFFNK